MAEEIKLNASSELQIRRDKLKALVENGKDPFTVTGYDVTATAPAILANFESFDGFPDGRGLPHKYKKLKLINGCVDPVWFIYLLTSDFDLHHWDLFYPGKDLYDVFLKKYGKSLF